VDKQEFKDYPKISENYHQPGELIDGFFPQMPLVSAWRGWFRHIRTIRMLVST
jgi:hypothetical protein